MKAADPPGLYGGWLVQRGPESALRVSQIVERRAEGRDLTEDPMARVQGDECSGASASGAGPAVELEEGLIAGRWSELFE